MGESKKNGVNRVEEVTGCMGQSEGGGGENCGLRFWCKLWCGQCCNIAPSVAIWRRIFEDRGVRQVCRALFKGESEGKRFLATLRVRVLLLLIQLTVALTMVQDQEATGARVKMEATKVTIH